MIQRKINNINDGPNLLQFSFSDKRWTWKANNRGDKGDPLPNKNGLRHDAMFAIMQ